MGTKFTNPDKVPPNTVPRVKPNPIDKKQPITVELLQAKCEFYFVECGAQNIYPTLPGFRDYIGVSVHWWNNRTRRDRQPLPDAAIAMVEQMIEAVDVQALFNHKSAWGAMKYLMMHHGWRDTQYLEIGRALELLQKQLQYVVENYCDPDKYTEIFAWLETSSRMGEETERNQGAVDIPLLQ